MAIEETRQTCCGRHWRMTRSYGWTCVRSLWSQTTSCRQKINEKKKTFALGYTNMENPRTCKFWHPLNAIDNHKNCNLVLPWFQTLIWKFDDTNRPNVVVAPGKRKWVVVELVGDAVLFRISSVTLGVEYKIKSKNKVVWFHWASLSNSC